MNVGVLVNRAGPGTASPGATTYHLAAGLSAAGHRVHVFGPGDFTSDVSCEPLVYARAAPPAAERKRARSTRDYVRALNGAEAERGPLPLGALDVLLFRCNPFALKRWAQEAAMDVARLAVEEGVLVLNDPAGLARASGKLYLQAFPEEVRPRTLVTRSRSRIEAFLEQQGRVVLKPVRGFGGSGVFLIEREDRTNLAQIVSSLTRDGFVVAQEYLPRAADGDVRIYLVNGLPLQARGRHAVVRRAPGGEDLRSNVHAGGEPRRAEMTDELLRVAAAVRPRLVADGMFLVGIDVAGDRILEINVHSPGGLDVVGGFEGVDFVAPLVRAIEAKHEHVRRLPGGFDNAAVATLEV